jgi:large subunit ribosomal protein L7e
MPGPVPESLLKKRKTLAEVQAKRALAGAAKKKANKNLRKEAFKRAEKYVKEYRAAERDMIRCKREAKNAGNYFVEPEAKVLLVIRIRGINRLAPKPKKILQLFRLRQLNNAVFLKANHSTLTMLKCIEPYVTYGEPNLKTISDLIYKRGHGKVHRQRIPLNSNKVIADALGSKDILCVEDLIHEIYTCGPNFKAANNFLWPIKLSNPLGGWTNKGLHFSEGGDGGRREEAINALARRMN